MRRLAVVASLALAWTLSGCAGSASPALSVPVPDSTAPPVVVVIPEGATGSDIGGILESAGVVSADEFYSTAASDKRSLGIQPGSYSLPRGVSAAAALDLLLDGTARVGETIAIEPGMRSAEVIAAVAEKLAVPVEEATAAFSDVFAPYGPEGRMGVATYNIVPGEDARALAEKMKEAFEPTLDLAQRLAPEAGYTTEELLTVASILPNEVLPRDWGRASRVLANRLNTGMRLQLDSTVAYAAGVRRLELTAAELEAHNPYNTYSSEGLPPGPIGAVSEEALLAAADPAPGDWLYWVTVNPDTGETVFTESYEDFLAAKQTYREWLASSP